MMLGLTWIGFRLADNTDELERYNAINLLAHEFYDNSSELAKTLLFFASNTLLATTAQGVFEGTKSCVNHYRNKYSESSKFTEHLLATEFTSDDFDIFQRTCDISSNIKKLDTNSDNFSTKLKEILQSFKAVSKKIKAMGTSAKEQIKDALIQTKEKISDYIDYLKLDRNLQQDEELERLLKLYWRDENDEILQASDSDDEKTQILIP